MLESEVILYVRISSDGENSKVHQTFFVSLRLTGRRMNLKQQEKHQ